MLIKEEIYDLLKNASYNSNIDINTKNAFFRLTKNSNNIFIEMLLNDDIEYFANYGFKKNNDFWNIIVETINHAVSLIFAVEYFYKSSKLRKKYLIEKINKMVKGMK